MSKFKMIWIKETILKKYELKNDFKCWNKKRKMDGMIDARPHFLGNKKKKNK